MNSVAQLRPGSGTASPTRARPCSQSLGTRWGDSARSPGAQRLPGACESRASRVTESDFYLGRPCTRIDSARLATSPAVAWALSLCCISGRVRYGARAHCRMRTSALCTTNDSAVRIGRSCRPRAGMRLNLVTTSGASSAARRREPSTDAATHHPMAVQAATRGGKGFPALIRAGLLAIRLRPNLQYRSRGSRCASATTRFRRSSLSAPRGHADHPHLYAS